MARSATNAIRSSKDINFTSGPLFMPILLFTLPILATGILQFLYNTADTLIVFTRSYFMGASSNAETYAQFKALYRAIVEFEAP